MKRLMMAILLIATTTLSAMAQRNITGKVVDNDGEALAMTTVKLLSAKDSSLVKGALTNENGNFRIATSKTGRYVVSISCVGFKNYTKRVALGDNDVALGTIQLKPDAVMLKETTITGHAAKVTLKQDTFVYNAGAFRTAEGSVIEELVKKLPGAEISDDGTIKMNGKEVKKILVDGKEFMTGDTKTALKNLPTSIIDKIKSYDQKSDLARVSGIDDGEEQTVLDFGIKKGMNKGYLSNNDLAIGTQDRYSARVMGGLFSDDLKVMAFGNANNTNDRGFGGGPRWGGGSQGLNASKMIGLNMNYEKKDKLKLDGHVRWNHSDGDAVTQTSTENFVSKSGAFSNSNSNNFTRSNSWDARFRLEWQPDTMTNIMFRPTFSYSTSDGSTRDNAASYNADPYLYVADPLSQEADLIAVGDSVMLNTRKSNSISYSQSTSLGGMLQLNRKLNTHGRNVTLRLDGTYTDSQSKSLSTQNVHLYQVKNYLGADSTYQTNRYNTTPQKNYNYSAQFTYSEPLWRAAYLQFSYKFQYKYTKSDRSTFDFSNLGEDYFSGLSPIYRSWDSYLGRLGSPIEYYRDDNLSRYSEYRNYIHEIQLMLRIIRKAYQINLGAMVMPQKTNFIQDYQGVKIDTVRTVTNVTPTADIRWKISNVSQLRINYRGTTSQPSMTDLLDITDDSDPLNVSKGNPGLKPSFTNNFRLFYNNYIQKHQQAIMAHINLSTTSNSISNKVTYDETTGGRTTQPENINGNWNMNGAFMLNTAIDTAAYFNVNTFTTIRYANSVGYVILDNASSSEKSTTKSMTLGERLAASYRNDWIEFELNGTLDYTHSRNELQSTANLDTWQFSYGFNTNITLPWGTSLSTDLNMNSRRGYNDASMNTNELIWNAQISQSFLRGNNLTLSLQFYDLLHKQSNFSRTINAMQRSDVQYNSITNYAMLHVIYRFNLFGGKEARRGMGPGGRGGRGDRPMGPPPGGFGGRPPRF